MSSINERTNYLREHLTYELLMARYALRKLSVQTSQLDWNCYLEAFAVHARNMANFLTNDDGNNEKAKYYVADFSASKPQQISSAFDRLNKQVLHLAKNRRTAVAKTKQRRVMRTLSASGSNSICGR